MDTYVRAVFPPATDAFARNEVLLINHAIRSHTFVGKSAIFARDLNNVITPEHIILLIMHGDVHAFAMLKDINHIHIAVLFARATRLSGIAACTEHRIQYALRIFRAQAGAIVAALAEFESYDYEKSRSQFISARKVAQYYDALNHNLFIRQLAAECAWNSFVVLDVFAELMRATDPRAVLAEIYGRRAAQIAIAAHDMQMRLACDDILADPWMTLESCNIDARLARTFACDELIRAIYEVVI